MAIHARIQSRCYLLIAVDADFRNYRSCAYGSSRLTSRRAGINPVFPLLTTLLLRDKKQLVQISCRNLSMVWAHNRRLLRHFALANDSITIIQRTR